MASFFVGASSMAVSAPHLSTQRLAPNKIFGVKLVSFPNLRNNILSLSLRSPARRRQVLCVAKRETVENVIEIVRKQLALSKDSKVTDKSNLSYLGADSLDTVEIMMAIEEQFGISFDEDSAQTIATVQDAAELIDKLVEKEKGA